MFRILRKMIQSLREMLGATLSFLACAGLGALGLHGLYLAWRASWVLAAAVALLFPTAILLSMFKLILAMDLARIIVAFLKSHGIHLP